VRKSLIALLVALGLASNAAPSVAAINYEQVEICSPLATAGCASFDASGNLKVNVVVGGGGGGSTTFPYNATNGQAVTTASFLGAGGLTSGGTFSPLQLDASNNLLVKSAAGSVVAATQSGAFTTNQTALTSGYGYILDSAGTNVAGVDSSHNVLTNVNAWSLGGTTLLGKVTSIQPYSAVGAAQTATATSAVGIAASNGTTVDAVKDVNAGQLEVTLYNASGTAVVGSGSGVLFTAPCSSTGTCAAVAIPSDALANSGTALQTVSQLSGFNGSSWDRLHKDAYTAGPLWTATGGSATSAAIAASTTGPTVIKATGGRIASALITAAGTTGTETFYDNSSACAGTVIGIVPGTTAVATAVVGSAPIGFNFVAVNGITGCGGTGSPGMTIGYF
jgi:hypothetical protein